MSKSLGVAYEMKRRAKRKKMAEGGITSAQLEKRPMPDEINNDKRMVAETSRPDIKQASRSMKTTKIKHPRMVESLIRTRLPDQDDDINEAISLKAAQEDRAEDIPVDPKDDSEMTPPEDQYMDSQNDMLAEGGEIDDEMELEHDADIASAVMARRRRMANGGQVDLNENEMEAANGLDELNEAALKENYNDLDDLHQPLDSNEHGRDIDGDEDAADLISAVRRRMKKKSPITR